MAIYRLLFFGCQVTSGGNQRYRKNTNVIASNEKRNERSGEKSKYQRWTNVKLCDRP